MQKPKRMHFIKIAKAGFASTALLLVSSLSLLRPVLAQDANAKPGAENADQQKMNAEDRELTAKIRRSVIADKSLSIYAHNVKIISRDGIVTLKGPVRSDDEVRSIVSKAVAITNSAENVINGMTVEPAAKP